MSESKIQAKVLKYLRDRNIYHFKLVRATTSGHPDVVACYNGIFIGIELKQPGLTANELQKAQHKALKASGGYVIVATSTEDVAEILNTIDRIHHI